ncbi:MAG: aminopeptidase P family N-terminal domain-containing protein, partial [Pseudomonadota bacterium]
MAIHFSEAELKQRRDRVCRELQSRGLDALLCFRQETDYYLTGYDTFGYCFFQCLV